MAKQGKISFTMYGNDKLKPVNFHGKMMQPLYIRVVYDRNNTIFKSYYFDLLSQSRYWLFVAGKMGNPKVSEIEKQEEELLNFIIEKLGDDFTLEKFKQAYSYFSQDFCQAIEPAFNDYLNTFFNDKGMPIMASVSSRSGHVTNPYDLVRDFKRALHKPLYEELVKNSLYYAPPYLPLYGFMDRIKHWPFKFLSVKEWESQEFAQQFSRYLEDNYPQEHRQQIMEQIERWLDYLRKQAERNPSSIY